MMNSNTKTFKSLFTSIKENTYMVSLHNSSEFMAVLLRYGRIFSRILFVKSKVSTRLQLLNKLGAHLLKLNKHNGPVFVVKYLKSCSVALQRFIGGLPLSSLREIEPDLPLPRLSSSGLPNIIPLRDRKCIEKLTPSVIRWWLTFFSVYRIISCPGKLKLNTITDPYGGDPKFLNDLSIWLTGNSRLLISCFVKNFEPRASLGIERIQKASPSSKTSWKGVLVDAWSWYGKREFFEFANYGQFSLYFDWFELIKEGFHWGDNTKMNIQGYLKDLKFISSSFEHPKGELGQLALKEEAAGKIRVFAMVDIWTQSVLKPLHDWLFDLFRLLPNDSTHNQDVGFLRAMKKAQKFGKAWCYDLSSATDRLPIQLQSAILDSLFGSIEPDGDSTLSYGQAWASLLVNRAYKLPESHLNDETRWLKYAVGQPMGALSSWAMLNLTHHLILQYINIRLYKKFKWYENYEVLGDDIVIFDEKVADLYLSIMEGSLDVKCNKSKSLISPARPVIEFAKRVSIGNSEVSPFSWRQARSFDTLLGRASMAADIISRRNISHPLRAFRAITGPSFDKTISTYAYSLLHFSSMMVNRGVLKLEILLDFLLDPKNPFRYFGGRILANCRIGVMEEWLIKYWAKGDIPKPRTIIGPRVAQFHTGLARGYLEDEIIDLGDKIRLFIKTSFGTSLYHEFQGHIGLDLLLDLFYPGNRYRQAPPLVDLDQLDLEQLLERLSMLQQVYRDLTFYTERKDRRVEIENSLKLLQFVVKSKKAGSLAIEIET